jgi:hypothetical protein
MDKEALALHNVERTLSFFECTEDSIVVALAVVDGVSHGNLDRLHAASFEPDLD